MIELSFVFGLDMRTAQMDLRALSKRRPSHITSAIVAFYTLPIAGPFWTTIKVMVLRVLCLARTMSVALGNLNVMLGPRTLCPHCFPSGPRFSQSAASCIKFLSICKPNDTKPGTHGRPTAREKLSFSVSLNQHCSRVMKEPRNQIVIPTPPHVQPLHKK